MVTFVVLNILSRDFIVLFRLGQKKNTNWITNHETFTRIKKHNSFVKQIDFFKRKLNFLFIIFH